MLTWILMLYQSPTAGLKINGSLSEPVQIHNGTRQGCPLSPILFILTLEPHIRTINGNTSIKGLSLGQTCHKIMEYADDLLFVVTQPHTLIPNLVKEFHLFGYISNFKINYEKSEALNISLNPQQLLDTKSNCPFKWVNSKLKYLGIWLTPDLNNIYMQNFLPFINILQQDLRHWNLKPLSWFGRAAALKMTVLPRALYLFHTLPIRLPKKFFSTLQAILRDFIWAGKKSRISMKTLIKTKAEGGINLPHFKHYYYATHLTRILDWNCHASSKAWVNLESLQTEIPLRFLPWVNKGARSPDLDRHHTIGPTLRVFQTVSHLYNLASSPGPLTSLIKNKEFALGHTTASFPP